MNRAAENTYFDNRFKILMQVGAARSGTAY
jgi:hypothetical protein